VLDNKNVIIGYSGHAYVVAESFISKGNILSYYTDLKEVSNNPFNLSYLGFESSANFKGWGMPLNYILGIGDNNIREKAANLILNKSFKLANVIDSNALISKSANIGLGIFASKGVIVNAFAKIGNFTILNTGCIIEHECEIGIAAHIAPGAILSGNVKVGNRSFVGANSVIKQGIEIGDDVIIGAGSVIINDVKCNSKIVGNPGRIIC
jgi:sugar O-acyltransferase (sialic acid O-acetyltransferase NeuD family)